MVQALNVEIMSGFLQHRSALEVVLKSDDPLPTGFKGSSSCILLDWEPALFSAAWFLPTPGAGSIGFVVC